MSDPPLALPPLLAPDASGFIRAHALLLGERLETRGIEHAEALARAPLVARVNEGGLAVLFRYGAVVLFGVSAEAERAMCQRLAPLLTDPYGDIESEEARMVVHPTGDDRVDINGVIMLREVTIERVQLVAEVLAESLALAHHEARIAHAFDRIEPLAVMLGRSGRAGGEGRLLLRQIGNVLLVQHKIVGRVGAGEKPDLLWDHPDLERLFGQLSEEYELRERDRALDRKLEVISRAAETLIGLVQQRSSMRVEWYIVALIVAEIVISVYLTLFK